MATDSKIIIGWVNQHRADKPPVVLQPSPFDHEHVPAMLHIGTGKLFTEEQVRAMVEEALFFANHIDGTRYVDAEELISIAANHGITL